MRAATRMSCRYASRSTMARLYVTIDEKPKRAAPSLKRLRNIRKIPRSPSSPTAGTRTGRTRLDHAPRPCGHSARGDEHDRAQDLLRERIRSTRMELAPLPVIAVRIERVTGWGNLSDPPVVARSGAKQSPSSCRKDRLPAVVMMIGAVTCASPTASTRPTAYPPVRRWSSLPLRPPARSGRPDHRDAAPHFPSAHSLLCHTRNITCRTDCAAATEPCPRISATESCAKTTASA